MTTSVSPYTFIHSVLVARKSNKSLSIPVELSSEKNVKTVNKIHALVDTGAGGKFIDQNFAQQKGLLRSRLLTSEPRSVGDTVRDRRGRLSKWLVDLERIRRRR